MRQNNISQFIFTHESRSRSNEYDDWVLSEPEPHYSVMSRGRRIIPWKIYIMISSRMSYYFLTQIPAVALVELWTMAPSETCYELYLVSASVNMFCGHHRITNKVHPVKWILDWGRDVNVISENVFSFLSFIMYCIKLCRKCFWMLNIKHSIFYPSAAAG